MCVLGKPKEEGGWWLYKVEEKHMTTTTTTHSHTHIRSRETHAAETYIAIDATARHQSKNGL